MILSDRQVRELEYHKGHAREHKADFDKISFDVLELQENRWWNAYWNMYRYFRSVDLAGKRVLVVGCGAGHDAIRLAKLGAEVYAFDLSPDLLALARTTAGCCGVAVRFEQMPAEKLLYKDDFFDSIVIVDILHHCEVEVVLQELLRVSKQAAEWVINEVYTHSAMQRIRDSSIVSTVLYPIVSRIIYRGKPYITLDEAKLDEKHLRTIRRFVEIETIRFYYILVKRVLPENPAVLAKLDWWLVASVGFLDRFLAARFLAVGQVSKKIHGISQS